MTITNVSVAGRTLVTAPLFHALTDRAVTDFGVDPALAPRVVDQALAFLATAGRSTAANVQLRPSKAVDPGWHAFLMYTRPYRAFCVQVAGRFLDHVPDDDPTVSSTRNGAPVHGVASTMQAIARAGFVVDPDLWLIDGAKCGQCHEDGNCSASGGAGDENEDVRYPDK
ncbi:glycine-rich domain-containing protein [Lentzea albidocapillata]|uniref:Uncharacterized protein n=1 Tax=Lentzea albidocapillata TaxID=40571 RepID=A0A1W2FFH9_9PSEU|nr:hypothetical protein [Lentzea albidocapillata]SMD20544.1 hypothetical protein SAMN05660733_05918 [Lentzea albidocapillata]